MKKKSSKSKAASRKPAAKSTFVSPRIVVYYSLTTFVAAAVFGIASIFLPKAPQFCANSISCVRNLNAAVENNAAGYFNGQQITPPQINLAQEPTHPAVLGETTTGEKHIYVDLEEQTVYAYQGETQFFKTLISSGKWNRTPTGDFKIWVKLRSTRMSGGSGADYYNLPNVPYTMFYSNDKVPASAGYSLHGAYWHNNFGNEMSHGCINLREVDAKVLYDWADPVTTGPTTHSSKDSPGTVVSVCNRVELHDGEIPTCIIE